MAQCSHPERWACKFVRVAGVALGMVLGAGTGLALEMALSAGFKTGVGAGLIWAPRGWQGSGSGGATEFSESSGYKGKTRGIGKNKKVMHLGFAARRRDLLGWGAHGDTFVKDVGGVIAAASTPEDEFELPRNGERIMRLSVARWLRCFMSGTGCRHMWPSEATLRECIVVAGRDQDAHLNREWIESLISVRDSQSSSKKIISFDWPLGGS
ncbi:hypothetical protein B0H14DRAFT_2564463 [Mycena olivaceomarginata]|nr:hypothetical protein B0H14DRAFT_2564463 [Mycena olivaceomarginata]